MKRFLIIISICLFSVVSFSQQLYISIDEINSSDLKVGDTVFVNVNINKFQNPISSFQMYLEFDRNVIEYIRTSHVSDIIFEGWRDNQTENYFAGIFISNSKDGIFIEKDDILIQLSFIYLGGETDINWCNENIVLKDTTINVETLFFQPNNDILNTRLKDGCICNHK